MYILAYVDDLIITGSNPIYVQTIINNLHYSFSLKDLGSLNYFLGVQITKTHNDITLSQQKYIEDLLLKSQIHDSKSFTNPANLSTKLVLNGDPFEDPKLCRQTIGALQYATITRLDIAFALNHVCQFMHSPTGGL